MWPAHGLDKMGLTWWTVSSLPTKPMTQGQVERQAWPVIEKETQNQATKSHESPVWLDAGSDTSTVHSNRGRGLEEGRGQVCWVERGLKLRQKQVRSGLYLKLDMGLVTPWAKGWRKRRAAPVRWPVAGRQPWRGAWRE